MQYGGRGGCTTSWKVTKVTGRTRTYTVVPLSAQVTTTTSCVKCEWEVMAGSTANAPWRSTQGDGSVPRHPIYSKLSCLNGEVNSLGVDGVRRRLEKIGLTKM